MAYRNNAIEYLWRKALADQSKARASLDILLAHPAGIGDHSTGDLYDNLDEALYCLSDAEDRIGTLQKYYAPTSTEPSEQVKDTTQEEGEE